MNPQNIKRILVSGKVNEMIAEYDDVLNAVKNPVLYKNGEATILEEISAESKEIKEGFIQRLCFDCPELLAVDEIAYQYKDLIPLCTELPISAGYCDVAFINKNGLITIAECKLWRNGEARRKVLAQLLDYAKCLSKMTYERFEAAIKQRRKDFVSLCEIVQKIHSDLEQDEFKFNVQKNLKDGKILMLIVGDRMRPDAVELIRFLNEHARMSFSLAMLELRLFNTGDGYVVVPNLLIKTKEIEHHIFIEDTGEQRDIVSVADVQGEFFSRFEKNVGKQVSDDFKSFVEFLEKTYNFIVKYGRGKVISMNVKTENEDSNMFAVLEDGRVVFYGLVFNSRPDDEITNGEQYLQALAQCLNAKIERNKSAFEVKMKIGNQVIKISDLLEHKNDWEKAIGTYIKERNKIAFKADN